MALFLRSLRSTRGPVAVQLAVARRCASSSSSAGLNSVNALVIGAGVFGGAVAVWYWHTSKRLDDCVGLQGLHGRQTDYSKMGVVHPEAEAEQMMVGEEEGGGQVSTPSTPNDHTPSTGVEEVDTTPDIPGFVPYVLIGAGTASFAAARAIRESDPKAKVLIVGEEEYPPYSRPPLSKQLWLYEDHEATKDLRFKASWSGGRVVDVFYKADYCSAKELPNREDGGISVVTGRKVTSLDPATKKISLDNGWELFYDKCLIATGGQPNNLPIFSKASPQIKERVSVYRTIPDYKTLDDLVSRVGSILVVGGGFLGSELAVGIASRGRERGVTVTQLFPEVGNLGLVLPAELSKWTTGKVRKEGVQVLPDTVLKQVTRDGDRLKVTTSNDEELETDHIVVAVGLRPNTQLSQSAKLETDQLLGGYCVNAELQACTDVWAAGDVACFFDPHLGRRRVEHHDHANVSGRLAGKNMAGAHERFTHQSMFWSDVGPDVGFEATGIVNSKLPTVGVWARPSSDPMEAPEDDFSKGIVFYLSNKADSSEQGSQIVGVLTWNLFGKMDLARQIISEEKREADIGELTNKFDIH